MKLRLDTHFLLWSAVRSDRLSAEVRRLIESPATELFFSAVSISEVAIKDTLGRTDFRMDPRLLRQGLLDNGYSELRTTGVHAAEIGLLLPFYGDPFDRVLVAQARLKGFMLLTADPMVARYRRRTRAL